MSDRNKQTKEMLVLGTLAYKNTELTTEEIRNKLLLTDILPSEIIPILDSLRSKELVTEIFTVSNVFDADSRSSIKYKITQEGMERYNSLFPQIDKDYTQTYNDEDRAQKNFNRKLLIGCAIAFVIIIGGLIAYILSTG